MATESSQPKILEESRTMLILLMRLPQQKLQSVLFESSEKALDQLDQAFHTIPQDFLDSSKTQIDEFRCRVNRMIMHHQKLTNQARMNKLRQALGCLKKIKKNNK
ncbi:unnamed protein product [Paramecium primaurelia]|uniref:Uncharacterized protein n=1 Tax=Paramecium primaurelia TaxID=5886 RepID=A0A8S1JP76_PARPR|nr:unnamed protein product [Paramecium primaurelia]